MEALRSGSFAQPVTNDLQASFQAIDGDLRRTDADLRSPSGPVPEPAPGEAITPYGHFEEPSIEPVTREPEVAGAGGDRR